MSSTIEESFAVFGSDESQEHVRRSGCSTPLGQLGTPKTRCYAAMMFAPLKPRSKSPQKGKTRTRPFFVDSHDSPRERATREADGGAHPTVAAVPSLTATFDAGSDHGVLGESTSVMLEAALARTGTSVPDGARHWAEKAGLTGARTALLHDDEISNALTSRLATTAFTVGRHVFMSSRGGGSSGARGQRLRHELHHVADNLASSDTGVRLINRAPPDISSYNVQNSEVDYHARDVVVETVLNAQPLDAEAYARTLDRGSPEETMAYLERLLRALHRARNLTDVQALSAKRFESAVFERFPQSSLRRPTLTVAANSATREQSESEPARSVSASDVIKQAKLTSSERDYAEQEGFFTVAGRSSAKMTQEVKALGREQDAKYNPPEDADKETKKSLKSGRNNAQIVLMKTVVEEELSILFPSEADPVDFWFGQHQTNAKFLGVKIGRSTDSKFGGVHKTFLDRLQQVESDLVSQLGCESVAQCGQLLGVRKIGGLRGPKSATGGTLPSMHVYGLAIDINDSANPMFRESKKDAAFDRENKKRKKRGEKELIFSNEVITMQHASQLIDGIGKSLNEIDRSRMSVPEITDTIRHYSEILKEYFALLEDDAKLAELVGRHGGGKSVEEWRDIIWSDYEIAHYNDLLIVAKPPKAKKGEADPPPPPPPSVAPLIDLHDELILAMEARGVQWGGRHNTPDIMHFDLRGEDFVKRRDQHGPKP